jgi:alpha-tubulin suppressor-like RCC1 family protein
MTLAQLAAGLGRARLPRLQNVVWGNNSDYGIGNGWKSDLIGEPVGGSLPRVAALNTGYFNVTAMTPSGTLTGNGGSAYGALGLGFLKGKKNFASQPLPVTMCPELTTVRALASNGVSSIVILRDGSVWTWGGNGNGKIGNGEGQETGEDFGPSQVVAYPVQVRKQSDKEPKGTHAAGYGGGTPQVRPAAFEALTGVTAVAMGEEFCLALKAGKILAWANNGKAGQCGTGNKHGSRGFAEHGTGEKHKITVYEEVTNPTTKEKELKEEELEIEGYLYADTNTEGLVYEYVELGAGEYWALKSVLLPPLLKKKREEEAGKKVKDFGLMWTLRSNGGPEQQYPVPILNSLAGAGKNTTYTGSNAIAISCGSQFSLGLLNDLRGTVIAWGSNSSEQCANAEAGQIVETPVEVEGLPSTAEVEANAGKKVVAIAAGGANGLALLKNGEVLSWGNNGNGAALGEGGFLGTGEEVTKYNPTTHKYENENSAVPQKVVSLPVAYYIGGGRTNSWAITTTHEGYIWGSNLYACLGNGLETHASVKITSEAEKLSHLLIEAERGGTVGNSITIELANKGVSQTLACSVTGTAPAYTVLMSLATSVLGVVTSTYKQVEEALNANKEVAALVTATLARAETIGPETAKVATLKLEDGENGGSNSPQKIPLSGEVINLSAGEYTAAAVIRGAMMSKRLWYEMPDEEHMVVHVEWPHPEEWEIEWQRIYTQAERTQLREEGFKLKEIEQKQEKAFPAHVVRWYTGSPEEKASPPRVLPETLNPGVFEIGSIINGTPYFPLEPDPSTGISFYDVKVRSKTPGTEWVPRGIHIGVFNEAEEEPEEEG